MMFGNTKQILRSLFDVESLDEIPLERLQELVEKYPSFHTGHYLLSKKLQKEGGERFSQQSQQTALHFNNPLWLQWLLHQYAEPDGLNQPSTPFAETAALPLEESFTMKQEIPAQQTAENSIEVAEDWKQEASAVQLAESFWEEEVPIPETNLTYNESDWEKPAEQPQSIIETESHPETEISEQPTFVTSNPEYLPEEDHSQKEVNSIQQISTEEIMATLDPDQASESMDTVFLFPGKEIGEPPAWQEEQVIEEPHGTALEEVAPGVQESQTMEKDRESGEGFSEFGQTEQSIQEEITTSIAVEQLSEIREADPPLEKNERPEETFLPEESLGEAFAATHPPEEDQQSQEINLDHQEDFSVEPSTGDDAPSPSFESNMPDENFNNPAMELVATGEHDPAPAITQGEEPIHHNGDGFSEQVLEEGPEKNSAQSEPALNISPDIGEKLVFEPYYTIDYFASQGIRLSLEELPTDRFGKQLKSFTDWLKTMKKLPIASAHPEADETEEVNIQSIADHSNEERDIITETMAEVLARQGKFEKAIDLYLKLSLLNPSKSAYFAARIEQLKNSLT